MEALLTRRGALQGKRADLERKIRDLGSLPADAFDKYREHALPALHKLLAKAQQQLKKYGCVCLYRRPNGNHLKLGEPTAFQTPTHEPSCGMAVACAFVKLAPLAVQHA